MVGPLRFRLLNSDIHVDSAHDWNPDASDLLKYNLHYFDDLNAKDASDRQIWHSQAIERWIHDNSTPIGAGWQPYPLSLRIVNWIKWALCGGRLSEIALKSLHTQVQYLKHRLEYHLLGNHLLVNAKALVFAGAFFTGHEARRWLAKGLSILASELNEQILPDGGHFELSPMYHSDVLEDVLDLVQLSRVFEIDQMSKMRSEWMVIAQRMRRWLKTMCHPDGNISFFNDAAFGVAPGPAELDWYAECLQLGEMNEINRAVVHLEDSGYVRVQIGDFVSILDVARVGPDYQPAHAHADTLSFELSVGGLRFAVNSGTSLYGTSAERLRQRSTAAHNTVSVDNQNSSDIWSGFRVGRRAYPFDLDIRRDQSCVRVSCRHDGYCRLSGQVIHRRSWEFRERRIAIRDDLAGRFRSAEFHLRLHPEAHWKSDEMNTARKFTIKNNALSIASDAPVLAVEPATYHPEFGCSRPTHAIRTRLVGPSVTHVIQSEQSP